MTGEIDLLIVGGGPCGLAAAIAAQRAGLKAVVVEAEAVVSTIAQYPTYVQFFSTAEKLALGDIPFVVAAEKPTRRDGLAYYRAIVKHFALDVRQYERVTAIDRKNGGFLVRSELRGGAERETRAKAVVIATGYFGSPNKLGVPGEDLPHVSHVYREGHGAFDQDVVVVGGGNSAAEAALDLWRSGARVTLVHFGPTFDKRIKPWVGPDLDNRVKEGSILVRWERRVVGIGSDSVTIRRSDERAEAQSTSVDEGAEKQSIGADEGAETLPARFVYVMTGFAPRMDLLRQVGVPIDEVTGIPEHDPATLETPIPGVFIAGVVVAGFDANKVFIENGRYHGDKIVARILGRRAPEEPKLSAELDT